MAVPADLSGEERARRGGAVPAHLPRHHGAQAAHRGGHEGRRAQQVRQAGQVRHQVQDGARLAALQPGHQQGNGQTVQPHAGGY